MLRKSSIKNDEVTSKIALDCDVDGLIFLKLKQ